MQEKQREPKRKRRGYTAAEFAEVWDRWGRGESSKKIAWVMDRGASVYYLLLRHGGIPVHECDAAHPRHSLWPSVKRSPEALQSDDRCDRSPSCWDDQHRP